MSVLGLDLAGVESRPTGLCILKNSKAKTMLVFKDSEILNAVALVDPSVIAIDAPLSLPEGRSSVEERTSTHLRECDRELLRRRIRFFPITLGPMRKLTTRGIALRKTLVGKGYSVIEVYPGGAQDVWGIPRKQRGLEGLRNGLSMMSVEGLTEAMNDHELDAVTCTLVGRLFLEGESVNYGTGLRIIVMPRGEKTSLRVNK